MKRWLMIAVSALILAGCGFPQERDEIKRPAADYVASVIHKDIQIADRSVWTSTSFKMKLVRALDRFPQAHPKLDKVYLWSRLGDGAPAGAVGLYNGTTLTISLEVAGRRNTEIIGTFYHELGHSIDANLSPPQRGQWHTLYVTRLRALGYKGPLGDQWSRANQPSEWKGLPSAYSLHSQGEYFAEHVEEVAKDLGLHKQDYPEEHRLMEEMELLPRSSSITHSHTERSSDASTRNGFGCRGDDRMFRRPTPGQRGGSRVLWRRPDERVAA